MEGVMKQWILFNTIELKKKYKAPSCDVKMARKLKVSNQVLAKDCTTLMNFSG